MEATKKFSRQVGDLSYLALVDEVNRLGGAYRFAAAARSFERRTARGLEPVDASVDEQYGATSADALQKLDRVVLDWIKADARRKSFRVVNGPDAAGTEIGASEDK